MTQQDNMDVQEDDYEPTEEERKAYWIARYKQEEGNVCADCGDSSLVYFSVTYREAYDVYLCDACTEFRDDQNRPEFQRLWEGETVLAVLEQLPHGSTEKRYLCYDCEVAQYTPRPKTQADYLETAENIQDMGIMTFTFLTTKHDMIWSENGDLFLGKVCEQCHKALGWQMCEFCHGLSFPDDATSHECWQFMEASEDDHPQHGLFTAVQDGDHSGFLTEGFTEHMR